MTSPTNKVDMAQMTAASDKVLALSHVTQKEVREQHTQRKVERSPHAKSSKAAKQSSCR